MTPSVSTPYGIEHVSSELDFSAYTGTPAQKADLMENGFYSTCCTCNNHYSIKFTSGTTNSMVPSGNHYIYSIGIDSINNGEDLAAAIMAGTGGGNPNSHYTKFAVDATDPTKLIMYDDRSKNRAPRPLPTPPATWNGVWSGWRYPAFNITADATRGTVGMGVAMAPESSGIGDVSFHIGPGAADHMDINLANATLLASGIAELQVSTIDGAAESIGALNRGIDHISNERGRMGAYQNRLEQTAVGLQNSHENLAKSESVIRDADMAKEMMKHVKEQILEQSSMSMLSQANQQPQMVLQLLS